jgi:TonB family protein
VLVGDDGAPLAADAVLAVAVRWHERPLTLLHLRPGRRATPAEGVAFSWEAARPVASLDERSRAWVRREDGQWSEAGRLFGLEPGELLVVEAGAVTLEARLQRRAAPGAASERRHENVFFGLVMAHTLMLAAAVLVSLVITPRVDDERFFGAPSALRLPATPFAAPPKAPPRALEAKVEAALARATPTPTFRAPAAAPRSAADAMRLLLGGGGAGVFARGLSGGIDAALDALSLGGPPAGAEPAGGGSRSLGPGLDPTGLGLGALGPGRGPGRGPGPSLREHQAVSPVCRECTPTVTPGYHQELVRKVVQRHQGEIRYCYESALASAPGLAGKVTVTWTIGATGAVETAQVAQSGLGSEAVEACIVQRVKRWHFPEPPQGQEVAVTFPWVFQLAGSGEE